MLTRRDAFQVVAGAAAVALAPQAARAADGFTLPKLPYAFDALEPHIDAKTMEIHHDKHHKTYVDNLNAALKGHDAWLKKSVPEILAHLKDVPEAIRAAVRNNAGGHWNHSLLWETLKVGTTPKGDLLKALDASFGTMDEFKKAFKATALKQFGSGWAWLVPGKEKPLQIVAAANQDNTVMTGRPAPIVGIDVWEHAYYLKYQNKRADYVDAFFNVINWDAVAEKFAAK